MTKNIRSITFQENLFSDHTDLYMNITPTMARKIKQKAEIVGVTPEELITQMLEAIADGRYNPYNEEKK